MTASHPAPTIFGERYVVERELGRGGMATVYLAEDRKHERHVAIKVLRPELAMSVGAERFLREIGITARLSHPHIVPLIDSGQSDGLLYYVSTYVAGGSLRDRLRQDGRLPVGDAIRIAREVGAGLDYAHRNGFVHRDVKPENILFADGLAVLTDFGVARVTEGSGVKSLTDAGLAVGTPEYMSPEQASGEHELGASSDVYSLACVTYEMLTGVPPLRGETARRTIAKQVTERARPVRVLRPDAPAVVEQALERALAKNPGERLGSIGEFTTALQRPPALGTDAAAIAERIVASVRRASSVAASQ